MVNVHYLFTAESWEEKILYKMSDSDDDWDVTPVILKKATVEEEEDLAVAEMAAEEAQKAQYQTKEPTEAEKRKEEVYQIILNPTPEYYKFIFILLYSLIGNVGE